MWQDGDRIAYFPHKWNRIPYASDLEVGILGYMERSEKNSMIWTTSHYRINRKPLAVLCQRDAENSNVIESTTTPPKIDISIPDEMPFDPIPGNKCGKSASTTYPKNIAFENICYFLVGDALLASNKKQENGEWRFNITKARNICENHGGVLIMPKYRDQAEFIIKNFQYRDFDQKNLFSTLRGIVLNLEHKKMVRLVNFSPIFFFAERNGSLKLC
jgi:hypothetical protein